MFLLFLAAAVMAAGPLRAHEMEGDRPDFTESAVTVPDRSIQFEGGYTLSWEPGVTEHSLGELLVRWGVTGWMEVRFGVNSFLWTVTNSDTYYGKDDMSFGFKFLLIPAPEDGFPVPDLSIIVAGVFPTGSDRYREPVVRGLGKICAAWELGRRISFGVNAGYAYESEDRERYHQASFSSVLGWTISERLGFYLEYFGIYPEEPEGRNAHYADCGLTFLAAESLQLDMRAGIRMDQREFLIGAGFIGRVMY